jgi:hypothetical protein
MYDDAMHPDRLLMATMKAALAKMNADLIRATEQARHFRQMMESISQADLAVANEVVDGSSYLQVLSETCGALDAMCDAYDALRTTIERRTATF